MNTLKRWKSNVSTKTAATASSDEDESAKRDNIPEESSDAPTAGPSSLSVPPDGIEPSPSAGSAEKLRLSLLQQSKVVNPGTTIEGHVDVGTLKDCKDLRVVITGKASCTIYGKMRYQAAVGVNALASGGYGGAAPVTFRESHTFLTVSEPLWDGGEAVGAEKPTSNAGSSNGKQRFDFSIQLPKMKQCTCPAVTYAIPPSVDLRHFDPNVGAIDTSTIEVKYSVSAILDRKGFLKRKQK